MNKVRAEKIARDAFGRTAKCCIALLDGRIPRQGSPEAAGNYRIVYYVPAEDPQRNNWKDWPHGTGRWSRPVLLGSGDSWEAALAAVLAALEPRQ